MARISKMSDQEKSVLLARAMRLKIVPHPVYDDDEPLITIPDEWEHEWKLVDDFYHPTVMALAWRCHLWMIAKERAEIKPPFLLSQSPYTFWFRLSTGPSESADAQRRWLDKILELAIEAGIIEE